MRPPDGISLLDEKRTETMTAIHRIKNGKVKMKETNEEVDVMQVRAILT